MRVCPTCQKVVRADALRCPADGAVSLLVETLPAGTKLGVYRIDRVLGDGGMGFVYEATHEVLQRRTAIKMLRPELASHPQIVTRFLNEAKAVNLINHDNIVNVYDYGDNADESVYFVMEYLEGATLDVLMHKRRPMEVPLLVHLFRQIGKALAAAHAKQIVHRDLKPANVYVIAREGNPYFIKLLDFGIAQLRGAGAVQGLTLAGSVMGTPQYMSPEQVSGGAVDARSDVWAFGVMMYRAAAGEAPFKGEEFAELAGKILYEVPRPPGELVQMPPSLSQLIMSCLARAPELRCPSIEAALDGLERVMQEAGLDDDQILDTVLADAGAIGEGPPPARTHVTRKSIGGSNPKYLGLPDAAALPRLERNVATAAPKSRMPALLVAGVAVVALGTAGGYLLTRKSRAPVVQAPAEATVDAPGPTPIADAPRQGSLQAALAAGGLPAARALAKQHLEQALTTGSLQARGNVVDALGAARLPSAAPLLVAALDGQLELQRKAARALTEVRLHSAAPKLRAAFAAAAGPIQLELAAAAVRLGDLDAKAALKAVLEEPAQQLAAALALADSGDPAGLEILAQAVTSRSPGSEQWRAAAIGLVRLADPRGKQLLTGELARPEPGRAVLAAAALAQAGDAVGKRELAARFADETAADRGLAARELARTGDAQAMAWVPTGLASKEASERRLALEILGALAAQATAHTADLARIGDEDADEFNRRLAEAVLLGL